MNPSTSVTPLLDQILAREDSLRQLWQMTPEQRVAAMYRGTLTHRELTAWSSRYPDQVPRLNGEFWWIAIKMPEVCE